VKQSEKETYNINILQNNVSSKPAIKGKVVPVLN
jgi:hypothetical protein